MKSTIKYKIVRSRRKSIGIEICPDGEVLVRAPVNAPLNVIENLIQERSQWIKEHQGMVIERDKARKEMLAALDPITMEDMERMGDEMLKVFPQRVKMFAEMLNVTYGRITIRNQKTRWGSCSSKGNLNFNCLLMEMPEAIRDYVIVHELCHRIELNHSKRFWALVEAVMPDYKERRRYLKEEGEKVMLRAWGTEYI